MVLCVIIACLTSEANLYLPKTLIQLTETGASPTRIITVIAIYTAILALLYSLPCVTDRLYSSRIHTATRECGAAGLYSETSPGDTGVSLYEELLSSFPVILYNAVLVVVYSVTLIRVHPLIYAISLVTTVLSFFTSRRAEAIKRDFREKHDKIRPKPASPDVITVKDMRFFGVSYWFTELYDYISDAKVSLEGKNEWKRFLYDSAALVFAFLRNGTAYFLLILAVLRNEMTVADFVLYFAVTGNFTGYASGLLRRLSSFRERDAELSSIRDVYDPDKALSSGGLSGAVEGREAVK